MNKYLKNFLLIPLLLILLFGIMIIAVPFYWMAFSGSESEIALIENRELHQFPQFKFSQVKSGFKFLGKGEIQKAYETIAEGFLDHQFQTDLEKAAGDHFPFRIFLTSLSRCVERFQIKAVYAILPEPVIPASLEANYFLLRDKHVYIQPPAVWNEERKIDIDDRLENYRELMDLFPNTNFFVFYLERMAYASYNPLNPYFPQGDKGQSFDYFLENKPHDLIVSAMRLPDLSNHEKLFYRTDHHWNIRGAWEAYQIIYDMLKFKLPELSHKLALQGFKQIEGVSFCGSYARRTLYPCVPDKFEYALVDLPEFITWIDGEKMPYGKKDEYLNGFFNRDPYTSHYTEFFGPVAALVEYDFENSAKRNLLIIGGSYTQAMQEFVAAHYDKTYVVDLREFENFSLGKFINDYSIDDILVIGDVIVYAREGWQITP